MEIIPRWLSTCAMILALITQPNFVFAADTNAPANTPPVSVAENWVNVSAAFTKASGLDDITPGYLCRCIGMIITPTGDIFIQTSKQGVCVSKDQGATWSVVTDNKVLGRCENGFATSIAYPYRGRMVFFAYDGAGGKSGGMSLDGGQTWKPFTQVHRGMQFGDVDWNAPDPQTIFGEDHEPFFTMLSNDAGQNWQQLYTDDTGSREALNYKLGVVDAKTLVRANTAERGSRASDPIGIIELSTDAGQTWAPVANFQVLGYQPVHYGKNLYWTTAQGVITSPNGKDWTLTGPGAEGALYGPFFGSSEQEFVIVTNKLFLKTMDGGKTWKTIAKFYKAPDIFHNSEGYCYFGWDAKNNILYASGEAASVYQLKL